MKEAAAFVRTERLLDPLEAEAKAEDIAYVRMDGGNVGLISGGAGLGMASMDMISVHGGVPANFLDLGGNATEERTAAALRIVLKTPGVEGILINLFGGINNCERMAKGIARWWMTPHPRRPSSSRCGVTPRMRDGRSWKSGQIPIVKFGTTEEAVLLLMAKI